MYSFQTKAQTLEYLYNHQSDIGAEVLPLCYFTVADFLHDAHHIYCNTAATMDSARIICRSSARSEDTADSSSAGKFSSFICDNNEAAFGNAVKRVISSYGDVGSEEDEVLVQPALDMVDMAGVAFTIEPNAGGHYILVNYDDKTGSTSSITDGTSSHAKLFCYAKGSDFPDDKRLSTLINTLCRMERLLGVEPLDVEFAFRAGVLFVLQARPLVVKHTITDIGFQQESLSRIAAKITQENVKKPFLYGGRTIYSVMSDWNPAEMIGIHPRPLALSLYKEIITDSVWAYQRHNYGYQNLRSFPLMVDFCGLPYIDVRVSFNSFIPASLSSATAEKLTNYYLARLAESPDKHDKIEFEIIFSCYTLDLPQRIKILSGYGFTDHEITEIIEALKLLTNHITNSEMGLWKKDAAKIKTLSSRYEEIIASSMTPIAKMYWLLEDCKRYGTLPFAGLARAAFIAVQILRSMVEKNIISQSECDAFMNDLTTVSGDMKRDLLQLSRHDFLRKYGHLRPGTYDITSPRYDEAPGLYFDEGYSDTHVAGETEQEGSRFRLSLPQLSQLRKELKNHGLEDDVLGLFSFIRAAIEGRESSKFVFTKNLSETLRIFSEWGGSLGFTLDELSYADIGIVAELYHSTLDERELLRSSIDAGKRKYVVGESIMLPPLIKSACDVMRFFVPDSVPTFVTRKKVRGMVQTIDVSSTDDNKQMDLHDSIAVIPAADPGYDWIFSRGIIGFVTEYGGANSHMAIRAGELAIPAVIGVGKKLFDRVRQANVVEIDGAEKRVRVLR